MMIQETNGKDEREARSAGFMEHVIEGSWSDFHGVISSAERFVLSSHINPDGDAVGSALALKRLLHQMGKDAWWVMDKPLSYNYDSFYQPGELLVFENGDLDFSSREVVIMTDAGFWNRLGDVGVVLAQHPGVKMCIDHHPPYDPFEGWKLVDTSAPSTTVLIYRYLQFLGKEMTLELAEPIYLGLIVDTQNFHLPNTTVEAHQIAAHCLEVGVDPTRVYEPIFANNRFSRLRLMSEAFHTLQVICGGKVSVMYTTREMFEKCESQYGEDEGFSDLVRTIERVSVGIYLREEPNGRVKVSWRARNCNNVELSARKFGGGGHIRAAGALIRGSLEEVRQRVIEDIQQRVEQGEIE